MGQRTDTQTELDIRLMDACYSVNPHPPILHHLVLTPPVSTRPGQPRDKLSWEQLEAIRCDIYEASGCPLNGTIPHLGLNCFVVLCCFCQRRQNEDITLPFIPLSLQLDLYLSRARALSYLTVSLVISRSLGLTPRRWTCSGNAHLLQRANSGPFLESWDLDFDRSKDAKKVVGENY